LSAGADVSNDGEIGEELFDLGRCHFGGVAPVIPLLAETNEAFDPCDIGLFGAVGVVLEAQNFP
jgi:hypothetical protein